ncbi:endonuclease/exonuclease/phosphatase family protein [Elizabethkingia meningoseptica]|uniref:endonuclease/exonuclease/phosphatase family protein n=1 Tax=Elizabethkingia meningoseptica TaxID=238 RepID=UPI003891D647
MRNTFLGLVLLVSVSTFGQKLKVMSFNIRMSTDSDKENSWKNRKEEALQLMDYYHPAVLGVQEALPEQMQDIKNGLPGYQYVGVGRDDGKEKGEFSAIFYDTKKLKMIEGNTFWLSPTPDKPSKGWDAALNRICTYALFQDLKTKKKFWAFNLHFDHIGNEARKQSSYLILKKMKALNKENLPVVLSGDFNLTEDTEPLKIIAAEMKDTFYNSENKHYGPKGTFQDFNVNVPAKDRIDYVFVKGFNVISHRHINDRRESLLYPSDHFPVFTELKFEK